MNNERFPDIFRPNEAWKVYRCTSISLLRRRQVDLYMVFAFVLAASTRKLDLLFWSWQELFHSTWCTEESSCSIRVTNRKKLDTLYFWSNVFGVWWRETSPFPNHQYLHLWCWQTVRARWVPATDEGKRSLRVLLCDDRKISEWKQHQLRRNNWGFQCHC